MRLASLLVNRVGDESKDTEDGSHRLRTIYTARPESAPRMHFVNRRGAGSMSRLWIAIILGEQCSLLLPNAG